MVIRTSQVLEYLRSIEEETIKELEELGLVSYHTSNVDGMEYHKLVFSPALETWIAQGLILLGGSQYGLRK